jgi:ATP-dependent 26S proteasome regulatory subunit
VIPGFVAVVVGAGGRCEPIFGDAFLQESAMIFSDARIVGLDAVHSRRHEEAPIADGEVRRRMGQDRLAAG